MKGRIEIITGCMFAGKSTELLNRVEKLNQKAEATVHLSGAEVFASSENTDMYAAIDSMVDKLDRQVIKHKEKLKKH